MHSNLNLIQPPLPYPFSLQTHHQTRTLPTPKHPPPPTVAAAATAAVDRRSPSQWIDLLRYQTQSSSFHDAIATYSAMLAAAAPPDNFAFPAVLKAATAVHDLSLGKQLHAHVFKFGHASTVAVANTLVNLYGKCGDLAAARRVFDEIPERDHVSWNSMIATMCRFGEWEMSLHLFRLMLSENVESTSFTLVSVAHACSHVQGGTRLGKQVHAYTLRNDDLRTYVNNALVTMYARLGRVGDAKTLFDVFDELEQGTTQKLVRYNIMKHLQLMDTEHCFGEGDY
ncbi:hypothetical protein V8G54_008195, partial [Vigna mungo]